jgi:hypothetical protein
MQQEAGIGAATEGPAWPLHTHLDWTNLLGYHVRCDRCPSVEILANRSTHVLYGYLLTQGLRWALTHECKAVPR